MDRENSEIWLVAALQASEHEAGSSKACLPTFR